MTQYTDDLTAEIRTLDPSIKTRRIADDVDRIAAERDDALATISRMKEEREEILTNVIHGIARSFDHAYDPPEYGTDRPQFDPYAAGYRHRNKQISDVVDAEIKRLRGGS